MVPFVIFLEEIGSNLKHSHEVVLAMAIMIAYNFLKIKAKEGLSRILTSSNPGHNLKELRTLHVDLLENLILELRGATLF